MNASTGFTGTRFSPALPRTSRQWWLTDVVDRPLRPADLALRSVPIPELRPGEVLVRNELMSVDPAMRIRMDKGATREWAHPTGEPLGAVAIGQVLASRAGDVPVAARVRSYLGFRDYAIGHAGQFQVVDDLLGDLPAHHALTVLGNPGLTAWVGVCEVGSIKPGETMLVTAASGGVGSIAAQIARLRGARVIGTAGTPEKAAWLIDALGADAAFDYRGENPSVAMQRLAPDGIDVFFDNTGGDQLAAAVPLMRRHGRIVLCGAASGYDTGGAALNIADTATLVMAAVRIEGFIVDDYQDLWPTALEELRAWVITDQLHAPCTIIDHLDDAADAICDVLQPGSAHRGKLLVRTTGDWE